MRSVGMRLRYRFLLTLMVVWLFPVFCYGEPTGEAAANDTPYILPHLSVNPPEGLLVDAWYRLTLGEQPVGYMRTAAQRKGDRIESLDYTQIRISRGPIAIKVIVKTVAIETLDGAPVAMHTEQVMGNQPMKYEATFRDGKTIELRITQGGNTIVRTISADAQTTLPWKKFLEILSGRRKPGESFVERSYAFVSDTKPMEVTNTYEGTAKLTLPSGRSVPVLRYKVSNPALAGSGEALCETRLLIPLQLDVPVISSMVLTATICTRQEALAVSSNKPAELFESLMLQAKVANGRDPAQAGSVLYTMRIKDDGQPVDLAATDMQQVVRRDGHTIELLVTRRSREGTGQGGRAVPEAELAGFRKASAYANSDDEVIGKMAAEAAGDVTDPVSMATRLTHYVYQKMNRKNLDVAFGTASEAARTLQGDCTEHAVLLAALARAKGLPARGALGMVGLPGSFGAGQVTFGYHMWTQIYAAGRWMDFDAALNQPRPDATHILLGISDLADSAMSQGSVKTFAQVAGSVKLIAEPQDK